MEEKSTPEIIKNTTANSQDKKENVKEIKDDSVQKPTGRPIQLVFRSSKHRNEEKKSAPAPVTLPPVVAEDPEAESEKAASAAIPPVEKIVNSGLITTIPIQSKPQQQNQTDKVSINYSTTETERKRTIL